MATDVGEEAGSILHAPSPFPLCSVDQFLAAKEETPAQFAASFLYLSPSQVDGAPEMEKRDVLPHVRSVLGTSGDCADPSGMDGSRPPMTDAELLSFLSSQRQPHPSTTDAWKMPPHPNASAPHPVIDEVEMEVVELSSVPEVRTGFLSTLFEDTSATTSKTTEKKRKSGRKGDGRIRPKWHAGSNGKKDFMEARANDAEKEEEEEESESSASPPMVLFDTLQWDDENEDEKGANNDNGISFFSHNDGSASTPLARAQKKREKSALGVVGEAETIGMPEKVFIVPDIDDFLSCRSPSPKSPPVLPKDLPSSSFPENEGKPQRKVSDGSRTEDPHQCTKAKPMDRLLSAPREQKNGVHRIKRTPREKKEDEKRAGKKKNATKGENKANPSRLSPPLRPSTREEESPAEKSPSSSRSSSSSSLSRMSFGSGSLPGLAHFYDSPPERIGKEGGTPTSGPPTADGAPFAHHRVEGSRDPAPSGAPSTLHSPPPNVQHAPIPEAVVGAIKEVEKKDGKTMKSDIHREPKPSFHAPLTGAEGEGAAAVSSPSPSPVYHFPDYRLGPAGAFSSITKEVLPSLYDVIGEITDDVVPFRADREDTQDGEAKPAHKARYTGLEAFQGDWKAYRLAPVVCGHEDTNVSPAVHTTPV